MCRGKRRVGVDINYPEILLFLNHLFVVVFCCAVLLSKQEKKCSYLKGVLWSLILLTHHMHTLKPRTQPFLSEK